MNAEILATTDRLIDLTRQKLETLHELRFLFAVAEQLGTKDVERATRAHEDLPPHLGARWPYSTPWKHVVTRARAKGAEDWTVLDPFIDRRTGLPVERRAGR